jgi:hypothetical protein
VESVKNLDEYKLMTKRLVFIVGTTTAIGLFSLFIPPIYGIVPVYEATQCKSYYKIFEVHDDNNLYLVN